MEETKVSVVIPVKDEEENIMSLAKEVEAAMTELSLPWECLWIDDGSSDETAKIISDLSKETNSPHKLLSHERCFGQSAAMATGFRHSKGEIIVTLDGDGQNDPASIPNLVKTLMSEKADVVNGWRRKRQDNLIRKISSKIANGFRNMLTGEKVRDVGCALRAMRKECLENIPVFKGMHRFLPTLIRISGHGKIIEIPVNHRPRTLGKTKYGVWNRLWVGIGDTMAVCWMKRRMVYPVLSSNKNKDKKNVD